MKTLLLLFALMFWGVLFTTHARAEVRTFQGKVKICRTPEAPSSSHGDAVISETNIIFVSNQSGNADDGISILVPQITSFEPDKETFGTNHRCYITKVSISNNPHHDPAPRKGTKWYRIAIDEGVKVPVIAEAIEDFGAPKTGKIKICRMPGITGITDGKRVEIPEDTYTGACNHNGENCRNIQLKGEKAILGSNKSSCVTINAELIETDGKPIRKGEHLLEQWNVPGFTPIIRAVTNFK